MAMQMLNADQVITRFVRQLAFERHPDLQVVSWPDKAPGANRAIDAVAEGLGIRVAVEHTSVDAIPGQRQDDDRFMRVVGELEAMFRGQLPCRLALMVDFGAVPTRVNWEGLRSVLAAWLQANWSSLPVGRRQYDVPGVAFPVTITKDAVSSHSGLYVGRHAPPGHDDDALAQRVRAQLQRKAAKLGTYKASGYWTVLLLESNDIALMSMGRLRQVVIDAFAGGLPPEVDEVWCAATGVPTHPEFEAVTRQDIGQPQQRMTNERACPHCGHVVPIEVAGAHGDDYYALCPEATCGREIALEPGNHRPGAPLTFRIRRS